MEGKIRKGQATFAVFAVIILIGAAVASAGFYYNPDYRPVNLEGGIEKFSSCSALTSVLKEAQEVYGYGGFGFRGGIVPMATQTLGIAEDSSAGGAKADYSETNIQVAGVDEADIVKTDGEFIYTLTKSRLIIAHAYPPAEAQILSETEIEGFSPQEMFIHGNRVIVFGFTHSGGYKDYPEMEYMIYPYYESTATVKVFDISDKANPREERNLDFEGSYVTSRKIGSQVYFVINSRPNYQILEQGGNVIPVYRDSTAGEDFKPLCNCVDVGYFEPVIPETFITVVSFDVSNPDFEVKKETILGSGENVYTSQENMYIAETFYPQRAVYEIAMDVQIGSKTQQKAEEELKELEITTNIHKFSLGDGFSYIGNMQAPGSVLNQFSMDEYNNHFRIATTRGSWGGWFSGGSESSNSIYIFDSSLEMVGSIEDIAPGETIYSARFMGDRGYMVTFKKIDPFFVIDLSDPTNPKILGKLKIPGYSDYLHPYDENHIIGIGKEAVEAKEGDFAWFQGIKMAVFDVTDVSNPVEMHKIVIGDRGTDSDALHDHKAFLFDREKQLLVIPILLAEIKDKSYPQQYGDYIYQGAYVYTLTLENGFELRGRVTHYEEDDVFLKSGYYFRGDNSVRRALYIGENLYTVSDSKIKINSLGDLTEIKELKFTEVDEGYTGQIIEEVMTI
jgi:uncharacterized secreted protein with C-terminal beta-propeller domain